MGILYGIVGWRFLEDSDHLVEWPVVVRFAREEADQVLKLLEDQRDAFQVERRKVIVQLVDAQRQARVLRRNRARQVLIDRWDKEYEKLKLQLDDISARHTQTMFDPLFPTTTDEPISYKIIEFPEDPQERGQVWILKERAKLHGNVDVEKDVDDGLDRPNPYVDDYDEQDIDF